jgi:replication factor C subunit 3/5
VSYTTNHETLAHAMNRPDLSSNLAIAKPDWETYCLKVADMIVREQTPEKVLEVRTKLYELLSHCIPPTTIIKVRFITLL